jgi:hypothetical protein
MFVDTFAGRTAITMHYFNANLHNILKQFHQCTSTFCLDPDADLRVPKSKIFGHQEDEKISETEAASLKKYDFEEF